MPNLVLGFNLLLSLLDRVGVLTGLLSLASKEGRDLTQAELATLFKMDDDARAVLVAAIAKAKAALPPTAI